MLKNSENNTMEEIGLVTPTPGILSFLSSHCNPFEEQEPSIKICGYRIIKWVLVTWLNE